MKRIIVTIATGLVTLFFVSCNKRSEKPNVLLFCKPGYFAHESIPAGVAAIIKLGNENNFNVDTTSDTGWFNEDSLKNYSAVIFLNTTNNTDNLLNQYQQADFERFIQAGGGFAGIHAASDAGYQWGWYKRLVGANFKSHPEQQQATLNILDQDHVSTKGLPNPWVRKDEWYNFKNINKDVHVLISIDEKSYKGGENGESHPMSWYHEYDGGRAWYTELGHTIESYTEPNYLKHLLGGITYAIGDNEQLNYSKATTLRVPDEDRFVKTSLVQGAFTEPTEMAILPNLDILVAQRRGEIMLYKKSTGQVTTAATLQVYWKSNTKGVNAEEGLLGIQADPDFDKNHWVYVFYSPLDTSVNRLSRFELKNDVLDPASEKVVLQFYSQREICCHTGGSIAFGPNRTLFVSAGDNSTPFNEPNQKYVNNGYAPLNDLPGHLQYDARRSSGNTNDLRGKILRIKIKDDGTYDIPEGNLFAKNTERTRPEIYVMGNRNPYRISVDKKNGNLYWGEVGPDAANDSLDARGPRGYDEVNQATKAGYFGWPLFVGNNYSYHLYNYSDGTAGPASNPAKPVNNSLNNTGLQQLPPAQPAFIWYPYDASPDFPQVGSGGRNAMAGPVYYTEMFPESSRYPQYYNNKLFIYEWIRGWVKVVTMRPDGSYDKMEPFMESTKFSSPIDMEVGPDGNLYVLEYGSGWFSKNPDAGLSRIDFNGGNRVPKIASVHVDKLSGNLPLQVVATVEASDPEKDNLTYFWDFGTGTKMQTDVPKAAHTYTAPGEYLVSVEVADKEKASAKSSVLNVYAGNETPEVDINLSGNKSFYFAGKPVKYSVQVKAGGDASAIDYSNLVVIADYVEGRRQLPLGHLAGTNVSNGRNIMLMNDCKACHKENEKSIGPSYMDVSKKYRKDPNAPGYLVDKIKKGGSGVWGETAMAAHPNLPDNDVQQIVQWVLSLSNAAEKAKSLPAEGSLTPTLGKPVKDNGLLYLTASYTNKPAAGIKPLTGRKTITLKNSRITFGSVARLKGYSKYTLNGGTYLIAPKSEGWFGIDSIDVYGLSGAKLAIGYQKDVKYGYDFELRLDAPEGELLATGAMLPSVAKGLANFGSVTFKWAAITDNKMHTLYIVSKPKNAAESADVGVATFEVL